MKKRLIAFVLTFIMLLTMVFSSVGVSAATRKNVTFSFKPYGFSTELRAMETKTEFAPGETVYIAVSLTKIEGIGGFTFKLKFDKELLSFDKTRMVYLINDSNSEYLVNGTESAVNFVWETTANNTVLEGTVAYIPFTAREDIGTTAVCKFEPQIVEVFEGNTAQTTINANIDATPTVTITKTDIDSAFIASVEALKTINYNPTGDKSKPDDSLKAIKKALEDFNNLSNAQQKTFLKNYPELYSVLSNALNEYYKLAEKEALKLIEDEANKFLNDNKKILAKDIEDITLSDKEAISKLQSSYKVLSDKAKAIIPDTVKQKITEFKAQIDKLSAEEEIKNEVKEFKENYDMFLGDKTYDAVLQGWETTYTDYLIYISEADMVYGLLTPEAQEQLKIYKERIAKLIELAAKYSANDAEAQKNMDEAVAFQETYKKVFRLNRNNVSVGDKTAIEMVIEAYGALENEGAKALLSSRINTLKTLLDVIAELSDVEDEDQEESSDTKVEYITETETITETVTETITEKVPETVTNTDTKVVNKVHKSTSNFRTALIIALAFLMISICSLVVTVYISQKQLLGEITKGGEEE